MARALAIHQRCTHETTILFSAFLGGNYFDQLRAERLVTKYSLGRAERRWEDVSGRRNEVLDTLTSKCGPGPGRPRPAARSVSVNYHGLTRAHGYQV